MLWTGRELAVKRSERGEGRKATKSGAIVVADFLGSDSLDVASSQNSPQLLDQGPNTSPSNAWSFNASYSCIIYSFLKSVSLLAYYL